MWLHSQRASYHGQLWDAACRRKTCQWISQLTIPHARSYPVCLHAISRHCRRAEASRILPCCEAFRRSLAAGCCQSDVSGEQEKRSAGGGIGVLRISKSVIKQWPGARLLIPSIRSHCFTAASDASPTPTAPREVRHRWPDDLAIRLHAASIYWCWSCSDSPSRRLAQTPASNTTLPDTSSPGSPWH